MQVANAIARKPAVLGGDLWGSTSQGLCWNCTGLLQAAEFPD